MLAAAAAGLAVALLVAPAPRLAGGRGRRWLVVPAGVVLVLAAGVPARVWVWLLVASAAVAAALWLWRARAARLDAARTSARVLEGCERLAADLSAGQPPGSALSRAAEDWPLLEPAAQAFLVGSDVPAALRGLASRPGAEDLNLVAAAWQVSHRTGQGLGDAVERVARDLRAAQSTRRIVAGELASARATARLVAGLPLLALAMGSGAGGDPWGFLLGHPLGLACLVAGLALGFLGLAWIEAIARDAGGGR